LPFALFAEFISRFEEQGGGLVVFLLEMVILFFVFIATILLVQGTRKIPVQYAKRIVGNKQYGGVRQYIPLKVNSAGVMPIIFAQALMFIPLTIAGFANSESLAGFAAAFANITGFWYNFTFAILIILFTYFYTAITINPSQMAEDMKKNGGFIPGVKPGRKTVEFLDTIMSRITLPGSIFLAIIAILPAFAQIGGVNSQWAQFYGGTSLLILVGVVLDTLQQIESHLLMRHYDGLLKSGRIKGRAGGASAI
jgi:preprotein translocase subunit SecY